MNKLYNTRSKVNNQGYSAVSEWKKDAQEIQRNILKDKFNMIYMLEQSKIKSDLKKPD